MYNEYVVFTLKHAVRKKKDVRTTKKSRCIKLCVRHIAGYLIVGIGYCVYMYMVYRVCMMITAFGLTITLTYLALACFDLYFVP